MLSLHLKVQPPTNCSNQNLAFNARPGTDNPSTALSAFLVVTIIYYNVSPTTTIPLLRVLNGIIFAVFIWSCKLPELVADILLGAQHAPTSPT